MEWILVLLINIYNFEADLLYRSLVCFPIQYTGIENRLRIKDNNLLRSISTCAGELGIGEQSAGILVDHGSLKERMISECVHRSWRSGIQKRDSEQQSAAHMVSMVIRAPKYRVT